MIKTKNFTFIRFWIAFWSFFGIIGSISLALTYFYYLNKYNNGILINQNNLPVEWINFFLMNSYNDIGSYKSIFLIITIFTLFTTVICNIGLIKYSIKSTDDELCANKWSLAVLSLTIGGFFTPFALTWLPNTNVKSTKNARITIVRYLGTSWLLSSFFSLLAIITFYLNANIKEWNIINNNKIINNIININNYDYDAKKIFIIIISILSIITILNFIFVPWFYNQNSKAYMMAKNNLGKWYRIIATIYTIIVTILLIFQILIAILKLLEAIADVFSNKNNNNPMFKFLNFLNLSLVIVKTFFMIYLIKEVIKGLWKKTENYNYEIEILEYKKYKKNNKIN